MKLTNIKPRVRVVSHGILTTFSVRYVNDLGVEYITAGSYEAILNVLVSNFEKGRIPRSHAAIFTCDYMGKGICDRTVKLNYNKCNSWHACFACSLLIIVTLLLQC